MSEPTGIAPAGVEMKTIEDVIARMHEIGREVKPPDGVAYFNDLYLRVTEAVHAGIARVPAAPVAATTGLAEPPADARELDSLTPDPGSAQAPRVRITGPKPLAESVEFQNKEFIDKLDVAFSEYYFDAYVDRGTTAASWRPLFEFSHNKRTPLQFAVCGMNAHINHDLPMAIVETAERLGVEPRAGSREHADFTQVNKLLAAVEVKVKREFVRGALRKIDDALGGEPEKLAMWSIAEARALAWRHAELLWELRAHKKLCEIYHGLLADFANLAGRGILV